MARQLELPWGGLGEAPHPLRSDEPQTVATGDKRSGNAGLLEEALARPNLQAALQRVRQNRGSPGIDGMTIDELLPYLHQNWAEIRSHLLAGTYQPAPVRRQEIRKDGGGMRTLGIPTVVDRLIQQALLQVLQPRIDPSFSDHSYGFRPGRSAHAAVRRALGYMRSGRSMVVDVDLASFFDRVNHDILMERLARRIDDRRVLRLIRRYLESGVMADGVVLEKEEGTPQGGPLSPLLANVLLDEVDRDLEQRGHAFVRYADDCNVYVRTRRAGERVLSFLRKRYAELRLEINEAKSAVAPVWERRFLGFSVWRSKEGLRLRISPKAVQKLKDRIREATRRTRGRSLRELVEELSRFLRGWRSYFDLDTVRRNLDYLDGWIRRRLRAYQLKQWKRGATIARELRALGASRDEAYVLSRQAGRWWQLSHGRIHHFLPNSYFDRLGLPRLAS